VVGCGGGYGQGPQPMTGTDGVAPVRARGGRFRVQLGAIRCKTKARFPAVSTVRNSVHSATLCSPAQRNASKRVKGIEPSTFSLGSCAPEFEATDAPLVTGAAPATMRNACPTPRPKATQSGHDSQLVAALSMLAELPLPDEVKVAALRKLMRV
jgi:hypothetical protein